MSEYRQKRPVFPGNSWHITFFSDWYMSLYKNKYRIETTRLRNWNYSNNGYYFFTTCTKNRECLFGTIKNKQMVLNDIGEIVFHCWHDLPNHYGNIILDAFVIMPDHVHGIIEIANPQNVATNPDVFVDTGFKPVSTKTSIPTTIPALYGLSEFIRAFKTFSARKINILRRTAGVPVWQSRFYDRIIRTDDELHRIRKYIIDNPENWNSRIRNQS